MKTAEAEMKTVQVKIGQENTHDTEVNEILRPDYKFIGEMRFVHRLVIRYFPPNRKSILLLFTNTCSSVNF